MSLKSEGTDNGKGMVTVTKPQLTPEQVAHKYWPRRAEEIVEDLDDAGYWRLDIDNMRDRYWDLVAEMEQMQRRQRAYAATMISEGVTQSEVADKLGVKRSSLFSQRK